MKEISRRAMSNCSGGTACGPCEVYAVDAEIVVEDECRPVYLHAQWVDAASDTIHFEATTESTYDVYEKLNNCSNEEFDGLIAERDAINEKCDITSVLGDINLYERYGEQYDELVNMLQEAMNCDEVDIDLAEIEE